MVHSKPDSLQAAKRAASDDRLDEWVTDFLASPGSDNEALAADLALNETVYAGPIELDLEQLVPRAGPDDAEVEVVEDAQTWNDEVSAMGDSVEDGWEPPPLLVSYRDGQLVVEDGNHRCQALLESGAERCWAIVTFADASQRDAFEGGKAKRR